MKQKTTPVFIQKFQPHWLWTKNNTSIHSKFLSQKFWLWTNNNVSIHSKFLSQKFWSWTKNNTSTHSKIPTSGCEQITTPAFIQNFCLKNSGCEQIATPAFIPNIYLKNSGTIFKSVGAHNRPLPRLKQKFLLRKSFEGFCKISRLQKRGCTWPKRTTF